GTELLLVPTALMRPYEFVAHTLLPARAYESQPSPGAAAAGVRSRRSSIARGPLTVGDSAGSAAGS
ncbi:hypothetical protein AB0C60_00410, partial [Streptomyces sp. NPDC048845]